MTNTLRPVVPAAHARSWQLVRGTDTIPSDTASDAIVFDLEDGVIPRERPIARENVRRWLSTGQHAWVRVNNATTDDWPIDLESIRELDGLSGVMLAKCESAEQVDATASLLPQGTPVLALVESARGIELAFDIASAAATVRIAFGTGDFRKDTGVDDHPDSFAYARGRLVVASKAAGLPGPIDGPTLGTSTAELVAALRTTRAMGMSGKLCQRSEDAAAINRELSPTADDVAWATATLLELGEEGTRITQASDIPRLARARRVLSLSSIFNVVLAQPE